MRSKSQDVLKYYVAIVEDVSRTGLMLFAVDIRNKIS